MDLPDQIFFFHNFDRLAISDLPLINVVFFAGKIRIVHFVDGVESIQTIAQQEQKFMRQDERNVNLIAFIDLSW